MSLFSRDNWQAEVWNGLTKEDTDLLQRFGLTGSSPMFEGTLKFMINICKRIEELEHENMLSKSS